MRADRQRIEQVLTNYISDAIKYSPGADKVVVRVTEQREKVKVEVMDFGVGIPEKEQNKIFQRFYRVEKTSQKFSGSGIGLFISSEIIKRHGGSFGLESKEGKGSTFYFTLPLTK